MPKGKKIIIFDVDGTLIDFRKIDFEIIEEIFFENKHIIFLHNLLWKFNDLDLFSNKSGMLKFRNFVYAVLSSKSPRKVEQDYASGYKYYSRFQKINTEMFKALKEAGYYTVILTHNLLAKDLSTDEIYIITVENKKIYIREFLRENEISYIVGNNYMDDLCTAHKLGIKSIYVGDSRIAKFLVKKKSYVAKNNDEVREIIEKNI